MAVIQTGTSTAGVANVDANFNLKVNLPTTLAQAGFAALASVRDSGSVTGSVNTNYGDISPGHRLRAGLDTQLLADQFNYAAQNTGVWNFTNATMAIAFTAGYADINSGNDVTSAHWAVLKTYRSFPVYNVGSLLVHIKGYLTQVPQVNNTVYLGVGIPGTTAAPTDGVYFQYDATGALKGVANWNGTSTTTAALTAPLANNNHDFKIIVDDGVAEFWIDGVMQGSISLPSAQQSPSLNGSGVLFIQNTNTGTVATAQHFRLQNVQVDLMDISTGKPWAHCAATSGYSSYQGQNGGTMGSTALYANSANPTAAVPTNTTAALGSGLGGNFWETASLATNTDGIIASYQNPAGSVTQSPRNLIITGVRWNSMVQTVLAGGPFVYECGIAFGHTAVSLATAEAAATKAPRRFPMGLYTLAATAAVGSLGANFVHSFQTPIFVHPGEFIQTIVRNIGTVGTSGTIAHHIGFEGYFE